jgi:hypothetical protein
VGEKVFVRMEQIWYKGGVLGDGVVGLVSGDWLHEYVHSQP